MTLKTAINFIDEIKPNAFSPEVKTGWINECEGILQAEIMLLASDEITQYTYEENQDPVLLAKPPYDRIYTAYLSAMIDFANGEYSKYQNTMELFNSIFGDFSRWYASAFRPADGGCIEEGYYISAYGVAKAHGFAGTEEEWLRSLEGKQGDPGAAAQLRYNEAEKTIEWKPEGSGAWEALVPLSEMQGEIVTATLSEVQMAVRSAEGSASEATEAAGEAAKAKEKAELSVGKTSYIGENGNWYAWNGVKEIFYDTGIRAQAGSLVYYGDNPPEDADVWIDPNGESCTFAPYIGENGNWYTFDASGEGFADSGVCAKGHTPQKGTDYWTETEKEDFVQDVLKAMPDGDEVEY